MQTTAITDHIEFLIDKKNGLLVVDDYTRGYLRHIEEEITLLTKLLPTVAAEHYATRWIRVEDSLPEPEDFYIVWANKSVFHMYYGVNNKGDNVWWRNGEQVKAYMIPTHWKLLPEPPQDTNR